MKYLIPTEEDGQDEGTEDPPPGLTYTTTNGMVVTSRVLFPPLPSASGSLPRSTPDSEGRLSISNR